MSQGKRSRKQGLVVAGLVALTIAAWLVIGFLRDRSAAARPVARDAIAVPEPADERTGGLERSAAAIEDGSSQERAPTLGGSSHAEPPQAPEISLRVYGYILPAEGQTALTKAPFVSLTNGLGDRREGNGGLDGAYSFTGISAGRYWITAGSFEDGSARAAVDLATSTLEKRLDLQLALPSEILVRVVDGDGVPLCPIPSLENVDTYRCPAPLFAVATSAPPSEWFDDLIGNRNENYGVGNFRENGLGGKELPAAYLGTLVLAFEPPVFVSLVHYQHLVQTKCVEKGQREVEFVLDPDSPELQPGGLTFHLVDASSQVLFEKADVSLVGAACVRMLRSEQGTFRTPPLAPGWYELRVRMHGYEALQYRSHVEPGIVSDLGDLALGRELSVAGRVMDDSGNGVGVELQVEVFDRARNTAIETSVRERHTSNNAGEFRIGGLSRGTYLLSVRDRTGPWAQWATLVDTTSGSIDDLRIELVRGVPLVLSSTDERWSTVRYRIWDASGLPIVSSRLWSPAPWTILPAPGSYELESRLGEAADSVRRIPITIASEAVELALP